MRSLSCYRPALLLSLLAFVPAAPAQAQMRFEGAGQQTALDCDGGSVHVAGADNRLAIRGACTELHVEGAANQISVDLAPRSGISVQGASNIVRWSAPAGTKPKLSISGAGNQISRQGRGR